MRLVATFVSSLKPYRLVECILNSRGGLSIKGRHAVRLWYHHHSNSSTSSPAAAIQRHNSMFARLSVVAVTLAYRPIGSSSRGAMLLSFESIKFTQKVTSFVPAFRR